MGCLRLENLENYTSLRILKGGKSSHQNIDAGVYCFGYNGMEKDKEIKGDGNSYTTEFRQYDPRLGRWLSLDPLMAMLPQYSPYVAFNNNPIYFNDPSGLIAGDPPTGGKEGDRYSDPDTGTLWKHEGAEGWVVQGGELPGVDIYSDGTSGPASTANIPAQVKKPIVTAEVSKPEPQKEVVAPSDASYVTPYKYVAPYRPDPNYVPEHCDLYNEYKYKYGPLFTVPADMVYGTLSNVGNFLDGLLYGDMSQSLRGAAPLALDLAGGKLLGGGFKLLNKADDLLPNPWAQGALKYGDGPLDNGFISYASNAKPLDNYLDVIVHGSPNSVYLDGIYGAGSNHRVLANLIQNNPSFNGQSIRLLSCNTGSLSNGFAKNLSNKLGVNVMAPNNIIWASPSGAIKIGPTPFINTGKFELFKPGL